MPQPYLGQLNQNEIFNALFNMIISIQTESNNIAGTYSNLVDAARVDGGLFGDTKLYLDTDVLETHEWGNDAEATNLLALDRPDNPKVQSIVLNVFRQIRCTVDNYLSKRAFYDEGTFSGFNVVLLGWIRDTKRVYDSRTYNTFIGTDESEEGEQIQEIELDAHTDGEDATEKEAINRLRGQEIAKSIADLLIDMRDATRDFNDYGFLRSFNDSDIKVIWNAAYVNEIEKLDLPAIFHKDGLVNKLSEFVLPARYFGEVTSSSDVASGKALEGNKYTKANGIVVRSLVEKKWTGASGTIHHVFPGDELPDQTSVGGSSATFKYSQCYKVVPKIICKIYTVLPPYMSAFEVGTSFFNPRSLTENHYLTFAHNTIEHLKGKPCITIKEE